MDNLLLDQPALKYFNIIKMANLLRQAFATHINLTKEQMETGVKHLLSLNMKEENIILIAMCISYRTNTGLLAFKFNYIVDRAIVKPALERMNSFGNLTLDAILMELKSPTITPKEKDEVLKVAKEEYAEIVAHGDFPLCFPGSFRKCEGKTCLNEKWNSACRIPETVDFYDIGKDEKIHRVYTCNFKDLLLGLAINKNPVTQLPFNPDIKNMLTRNYALPVKIAYISTL